MDIVICDDSESDALSAKDVIKQTVQELHMKADFYCYSNATDVERKLLIKNEPSDILILDIDMPEVSGLELAEKLRSVNKDLIIIFLSNHEEFVFKAIEFQPFRYIRKIYLNNEMPLAIRSAAKVIEAKKDKQIILNTDNGEMKVMISEIMYFETEKRKIAVHLQNNKKMIINKTISEVQKMINKENFIMIHRCCVVNADYIKNISNGIVTLDNSEKLIVSRPRCKTVKQQLLKVWGDLL
ncbi:MAG: response regulator transcription factor [Ruminococcus sp.]|nr:response regulator transcription factor [Ruminococcus sp.]